MKFIPAWIFIGLGISNLIMGYSAVKPTTPTGTLESQAEYTQRISMTNSGLLLIGLGIILFYLVKDK